MSAQSDLIFLLSKGWKLVGINLVESPDGSIQTNQIEKVARLWRTKLKAQGIIDQKKSAKFLRKHLTRENFWNKLFHGSYIYINRR